MMKHFKMLTICIMAVFYINVGAKHFVDPDWFLPIMPPDYPMHYAAVYVSGFFEVLFGFFLILPKSRFYAAWGLIYLLILVFPANLYLAVTDGAVLEISKELAWGRLPIQFVFIGLAYWHSYQ